MSATVWSLEHSLGLPFFGIGMKTDIFQSCGHCWIFQICWHIECSTFTASSFRIWNSSTGISSPPLALFIVMLPKACLISYSRMSGSRWVITPLWLSGSWRSFLYSSSVYSYHLFLISSASVRSISFLSFFFFLVLPLYCYQPISLHPHAHLLSHVIPWTAAHQAPLSMDFPGKNTGVGYYFLLHISVLYWAHLCMKCSLGVSNLLKEISSLSHSIVLPYFFALITEEGFFISSCYSLGLCVQMGISFLFSFAFRFSSFHSYL